MKRIGVAALVVFAFLLTLVFLGVRFLPHSASSEPGEPRWTPLMHAIHHNEIDAVRELLTEGADPNTPGVHGFTPLMMAAGYGYTDIVRLLLEAGADPHATDVHSVSALDLALTGTLDIDRFTVHTCQPATVAALLEHAPDLRPHESFFQNLVLGLKSCPEVDRLLRQRPIPSELPAKAITVELPGLPAHARKLEMILVEPGSFTMGSADGGRDWPPHHVNISRPFYLGKFEVTQAQWRAIMDENNSYFREKPNHPAEKITWGACEDFVEELNKLRQGRFRLPTEAEWEYACRAGTRTRYSFGDDLAGSDDYMWWRGNNQPEGTKAVGLKRPNAWGFHDMHGNVHEWCSDRWEDPRPRGAQTDPQGPDSGSRTLLFFTNRVFRGGCWNCPAEQARSAWRRYEQSMDRYYGLGLRLAREI